MSDNIKDTSETVVLDSNSLDKVNGGAEQHDGFIKNIIKITNPVGGPKKNKDKK